MLLAVANPLLKGPAMVNCYTWYIKDAHMGMLNLSLEERSVYRDILDLIYLHDGACPDEDGMIAEYCGCHIRTYRRIRHKLIAIGRVYLHAGTIRDGKADEVVVKAIERRHLLQHISKIGVNARKSKVNSNKNNDLFNHDGSPTTESGNNDGTSAKDAFRTALTPQYTTSGAVRNDPKDTEDKPLTSAPTEQNQQLSEPSRLTVTVNRSGSVPIKERKKDLPLGETQSKQPEIPISAELTASVEKWKSRL
jgi:hypothetical protein